MRYFPGNQFYTYNWSSSDIYWIRYKDILFTKSAEKVDAFRPEVAADTFGEKEAQDAIDQASAEISGEAAAERAGEEPAPSI